MLTSVLKATVRRSNSAGVAIRNQREVHDTKVLGSDQTFVDKLRNQAGMFEYSSPGYTANARHRMHTETNHVTKESRFSWLRVQRLVC